MTPISALRPLAARTCRCFSARSYSPAKQSSSKRKVRFWPSSGCWRTSSVIAPIASPSWPARRHSVAFMVNLAALLVGYFYLSTAHVDLGCGCRRQGAVGLLLFVLDEYSGEVDRDILHRSLAALTAPGGVGGNHGVAQGDDEIILGSFAAD